MSRPLAIGLDILAILLLNTVMLSSLTESTWLCYAFVLVLLGGLLVIFIYVSLLASNEVFIPSKKTAIVATLTFLSIVLVRFNLYRGIISPLKNENFNDLKNESWWLRSLYSREYYLITLFLILYLLLTLIVVVFNTKNNYSSLRSFKN